MKKQEAYWSFRAPDIPEFDDLPQGSYAGTRAGFESLSPGYRREIYRSAVNRYTSIDAERMARADEKHRQSIACIERREAL